MIFLGIDPGIKGALAWVRIDGRKGTLLQVKDMPIRTDGRRARVDAKGLRQLVIDFLPWYCVVEEVATRKKDGLVGAFSFGRGFGVIEGVLAGCVVRTDFVTPQVWKKHAGLTSDKDLSRSVATEYWPDHAAEFKRKKDDGRAEAALLARWYGLSGRVAK